MIQKRSERGGIFWKLLVLVTFVLLAGTMYLLRHPLLRATASLMVVDEVLAPSDAIIVLGDDNLNGDRARHAAKLYRERWAPRVVASGRYIRPYATMAELIRRDLVINGVDDAHILVAASMVANTREEAYEMRRIIREQRWRRVIVVTSTFHTRRSRYIFRRVLDKDTQLIVSAADDTAFPIDHWWDVRSGLKIFLWESAAWPAALWEMSGEQKEPVIPPPPRFP